MESTGKKVYKVVRWVVLIALVAVVLLMLKRPTPAAAPISAVLVEVRSKEFNTKLQNLQAATEHAQTGHEESFSSDEVNAFVADSTVRAAKQAAGGAQPVREGDEPEAVPLSETDVQAALDKTQIAFEGDEVIAQTSVQQYGRDIFVTVRGKLSARDGYLHFEPTGFKIGSLSVPVSLVNDRLQAKLAEPENHDKLKLPSFIADLRVENGQLKIREK